MSTILAFKYFSKNNKRVTMKIACLGWGSLIWNPGVLPIRGKWFEDGPLLPIEFARESRDGRITLVIADVEYRVRSLWAIMSNRNLDDAKKHLAMREGITEENIKHSIGFWDRSSSNSHGLGKDEIADWAVRLHLDAVVWTNLKYGFRDSWDTMPTIDKIIKHFKVLPHPSRKVAQQYIQKAPIQIDTDYRRAIEAEFGWTPIHD